jgi:transcriptional regulator with XRE-family HTH domain
MTTIVNGLDRRLAQRLKAERETRGWSTADLAERSGVSKAMISKVERGESSPTASLLGKLSGAFELTLSTLLARAEGNNSGRISRASEQMTWSDSETGLVRTSVSAPGSKALEIVKGRLPRGARVNYPAAAYGFIDQQILVLDGILTFTEGATAHRLGAGDCLELGPPQDCSFENRSDKFCTYLVIIARRS